MFIQVAETPNPNALKFILEEQILEGEKYTILVQKKVASLHLLTNYLLWKTLLMFF